MQGWSERALLLFPEQRRYHDAVTKSVPKLLGAAEEVLTLLLDPGSKGV